MRVRERVFLGFKMGLGYPSDCIAVLPGTRIAGSFPDSLLTQGGIGMVTLFEEVWLIDSSWH